MKFFGLLLISLLFSATAIAEETGILNDRIAKAFGAIENYNTKQKVFLSGASTRFESSHQSVVFIDELPLEKPAPSWRDPDGKQQNFEARTIFLKQSPTIEKRVHLRQGPEEMARMRFVYRPKDRKKVMAQYTYQKDDQAWHIYESTNDIFFYTQEIVQNGDVQLKEWIYAEAPNVAEGSSYDWDIGLEEFNRFSDLVLDKDGTVAIQRHVMVSGVDKNDRKEQERVVSVVRQAMKKIPIYIHGEDVVGRIQPVRYWTREGLAKQGMLSVKNGTRLTVTVREPVSAYPLVIDPTVVVGER